MPISIDIHPSSSQMKQKFALKCTNKLNLIWPPTRKPAKLLFNIKLKLTFFYNFIIANLDFPQNILITFCFQYIPQVYGCYGCFIGRGKHNPSNP